MTHDHLSDTTMKVAVHLYAAASGAGIDLGLPMLSKRIGDALFFPITDGFYPSVIMCTPYVVFIEGERFGAEHPVGVIGDLKPFISHMASKGLRGLTDKEKESYLEGDYDETE